ncbi:hypothetical protein D3C75_439550 [compost metagenome]
MTNQIENTVVENVEVVVTKAELALKIYQEEFAKGVDKLRARVIARFIAELNMGKPGSSTYFQNCKKKAVGEKVKHYYKRVGEKNSSKDVDNSSDDVPEMFEVKLLDGTIKCFMSQRECDLFIESNPSIVDPDQSVEEEEQQEA